MVLKFFPEDAPAEPSNNLKAMRVSDLLRMSTGHQTEPPRTPVQPWTKTFLAHPVPFKPGTHFLYNTSATYMLSAIVQKATGMTVLDYLKRLPPCGRWRFAVSSLAPLQGIGDDTSEQMP
jgi:CubicO group peptidase (beta-lactamase class C family)